MNFAGYGLKLDFTGYGRGCFENMRVQRMLLGLFDVNPLIYCTEMILKRPTHNGVCQLQQTESLQMLSQEPKLNCISHLTLRALLIDGAQI